jgi:hypothetical protein
VPDLGRAQVGDFFVPPDPGEFFQQIYAGRGRFSDCWRAAYRVRR